MKTKDLVKISGLVALLYGCGETDTLSLDSCDVRNCSSIYTLQIGDKDLHPSKKGPASVEFTSWGKVQENDPIHYGVVVNGQYIGDPKGDVTVGNCYPIEEGEFMLVDSRIDPPGNYKDQSEIDYCILGE